MNDFRKDGLVALEDLQTQNLELQNNNKILVKTLSIIAVGFLLLIVVNYYTKDRKKEADMKSLQN